MRRLMAMLVCLAATGLCAVPPASATPQGILVGHTSAGLAAQMTAVKLARTRALALPAPRLFSSNPLAHVTYGGSQPAFPIYSEGYVRKGRYYRTVGRLYARISSNVTGTCTATVVARRVIVTAAHCLVSPTTGKVYSAFVFIPAQYGKRSPEGRWIGQTAYIWKAWVSEPYESLDYGFLTIRPNKGRNIGAVTGWEGILANSNVKRIRSFGYPGGGMFAKRCNLFSCYQWECYSPLGMRVRDPTGLYEVGMGCHGEEGSSGGPWFERYHGHRYLASNVSTGVRRTGARHDINEWGPYYDGHTLKLLSDATSGK